MEFEDLEKHALEWGEPPLFSGKQVRITLLYSFVENMIYFLPSLCRAYVCVPKKQCSDQHLFNILCRSWQR